MSSCIQLRCVASSRGLSCLHCCAAQHQLTAICSQTPDHRTQAEQMLRPFSQSTEYIAHCKVGLTQPLTAALPVHPSCTAGCCCFASLKQAACRRLRWHTADLVVLMLSLRWGSHRHIAVAACLLCINHAQHGSSKSKQQQLPRLLQAVACA